MPPQGLLTFPGLQQIRSWSFTLSHGIAPGVAHVEIAPQFGVPAEIGTMILSFGDVALAFPGCVLDSAHVRRDASGMVVSLALLDRRWAWRYGQISGRYNVRRRNGALDPETERTPQDLAMLLLAAMGESLIDVSGLPNLSRPEVDWVFANPAQELAALAESLGCRVVLGLDGRVTLPPAGIGADLPEGARRTQNFGIDPPTRPDSLLLVMGPTRFQTRFRLEAVGLEKTGEIKPVNSLSYMPAAGWANEAWFGFANVADADNRALACRTVYRWYRIKCTAPFTTAGQFQIGGYDGEVDGLWQVLPLERGQVETSADVDQIERSRPPEVTGIYWDRSLDSKNIPAQRRYRGPFSIDAERGIVRFGEPVMKVDSSSPPGFAEAELYLTVAHGVKDRASLQEVRRTTERATSGAPIGIGPRVIRRDDLAHAVVTEYDGNNPTGTTDNASEIDQEAGETLDAVEAAFQTLETDQAEYAGLVPISPDGAIQQVEWRGGLSGCVTRAGRNSEFSLAVPTWHERRIAERRRDDPPATAATVAAVREIRNVRGGR